MRGALCWPPRASRLVSPHVRVHNTADTARNEQPWGRNPLGPPSTVKSAPPKGYARTTASGQGKPGNEAGTQARGGRLEITASLVLRQARGGVRRRYRRRRGPAGRWAVGKIASRCKTSSQPPYLPGRRQQRQATFRLPRPVGRGDQDADPGGVDEGDAGHVDGQLDVPAADCRQEDAPDGRGGGDVDLPVEDDGS